MPQEQSQDRFALAELFEVQLPDGTYALRNRRNGRELTLPVPVFNAISYCSAFRTIDEHVADLARANPETAGQEHQIRQILQSVIDNGVMQSASEICAQLEPVESVPIEEDPVVGILTCDRPESLERLLQSMLQNCDLQRVHSIVVYDDSRSAASVERNSRTIDKTNRDLEGHTDARVFHVDQSTAWAITDALVEALPESEDGIRLLLDRRMAENLVTTGIGHNHCMLFGVGRPLLVFDDDVLCEVHEPPSTSDGVSFHSEARSARFYQSNGEWAKFRAQERVCPIRLQMKVLGTGLRQALHLLGRPPTPDSFVNATLQYALSLGDSSRVAVTACGSYGDPGTGGNQWLAMLNAESRRQLLSDRDGVQTALQERNCWLGRSQPTFEPAANMSQLIGLDNRSYLPPRFPYMRGHDKIFGALASFVQPDGLTADLPFALPHLPMPPREWKEEHNTFSLPFKPFDYVMDHLLVQSNRCKAKDPMVRNGSLAAAIGDLSDWPHKTLSEVYEGRWFNEKILQIIKLQEVLDDSPGAPDVWISYIKRAMSEYRACKMPAFHSELANPQPTGQSDMTILDFCKDVWGKYSEGARAWPRVRELAPQIIDLHVPNWSSARRE